MKINRNHFILLLAGLSLVGCNIGDAPSGGDSKQVEAAFKGEDPQTRINTIKNSPASPEKKAELIAQIEKETGHKDNGGDVVGGGTESHPANAPGIPSNGGPGANR